MPHIFDEARNALELCRFAYKIYAQSVEFPYDPFFEADLANQSTILEITRNRMMRHIHDVLGTPPTAKDIRELDPIQYKLDVPPDPARSTIYRGETDNTFLVFVPGTWDMRIGGYAGFSLDGNNLGSEGHGAGNATCAYFQGRTGMTVNHPTRGWPSFMGAAIYDPDSQAVYITFRGSRSGAGGRALLGAQLHSSGNPDWVTDMNHLKESSVHSITVGEINKDVILAAGFWKAYASCRKSLKAAYLHVARNRVVKRIFITGHSLGGALAQCAYIDFNCGQMRIDTNISQNTSIHCYPISSPPVCIGVTTQHWISRSANASNVHHYYCPYDTVHACNLVLFSGYKFGNKVIAGLTHPATSPLHFGSQLALDSTSPFPEAHEPYDIWKALWKGEHAPDNFWQEIELNTKTSSVTPTPKRDSITRQQIGHALQDSFNFNDFMRRAGDWADGITKTINKTQAEECIRLVVNYYSDQNYHDAVSYAANIRQREQVIATINRSLFSCSSDTAKCVYHTLLVAIGVQRLLKSFNLPINQAIQRRVGRFNPPRG